MFYIVSLWEIYIFCEIRILKKDKIFMHELENNSFIQSIHIYLKLIIGTSRLSSLPIKKSVTCQKNYLAVTLKSGCTVNPEAGRHMLTYT
jgi:hypothetical protein